MNEIKVLAELSKHIVNNSSSGLSELKQGKESTLLKNTLNNVYNNDYVASKDLYGTNPNDVRYKMLKVRLKKKLYNNLFFVDFDKYKVGKVHQAELECIKLLHHAHALLRLNELDLVLYLVGKVKKVAIKYEFNNCLIDATELELTCYTESGNYKDFKSCRDDLSRLLKIKLYEREAQTIYQSLKLNAKRSVKLRKSQITTFGSDLKRLYDIYCMIDSFEAFNAYYRASLIYNEMLGNFEAIVDLTIESENKIKSGKINTFRFNRLFNKFELIYSHLRARKLNSGLHYASEYLHELKENTPNWYAYLENYFLLAVHSAKYELASSILQRVQNSSNYLKLSAAAKERWSLYEAYNLLLSETDGACLSGKNPFLIYLPEYSKDKQGFNVAILILQFVYFLKKKETEALLYRIESLKKYILTHLKDSFSLRSKTFLRLLILTVTEDFDADSSRKKGQKLYHRLSEAPTPGDAYAEIEIVPYEHLWEHILVILENEYK